MNHSPNQQKQTPAEQPKKHRVGLKRWIAFIILGLIVIGTSAGAAVLLHKPEKTATTPTQGTTPPKSDAIKKTDAAQKLAAQGNADAGITLLDNAINNTADTTDKATYTGAKAVLQLQAGNRDAAYTTALSSYKLDKSSNYASLVAQIAAQKKDAVTAIEYYQKAIDSLDKNSPIYNSKKSYYQTSIDNLKAGRR